MIKEVEATYQTLVDDGYVADGDALLNSAIDAISNRLAALTEQTPKRLKLV